MLMTMQASSLFSICPSCRVRANIQRAQAGLRCLSCNFDFASLARDPVALERWMGDNLRDGSFEMTVTLTQLIEQLPEPQARTRVTDFGARHAISMPSGRSGRMIVLAAVGFLVVAALLGGIIFFFATR